MINYDFIICISTRFYLKPVASLIVQDLDDVDVQLPQQLEQLVYNLLTTLFAMGIVAWVYPYFLVACVPIFCLYFYLFALFKPSQREVKRLDNVTRSPVVSWLSASLQGLPTLHAYRREQDFIVVWLLFYTRLTVSVCVYILCLLSDLWCV